MTTLSIVITINMIKEVLVGLSVVLYIDFIVRRQLGTQGIVYNAQLLPYEFQLVNLGEDFVF